jgi:hypothetical protein
VTDLNEKNETDSKYAHVKISLIELQKAFSQIAPDVGHIYNDQFYDFVFRLWHELNKK